MGKIIVETCPLAGLKVIIPEIFKDERGYFTETYSRRDFAAAGIDAEFVQDNHSSSKKGVLRGMHYQIGHPQDKLVRVVYGKIYDAVIDLRKDSDTFGKWFGIILSAENRKQLFIPRGFAHGFVVLSDTADFEYKCSDFFYPDDEGGIKWDDPDVAIEWPLPCGMTRGDLIISGKDQKWKGIKSYRGKENDKIGI